MSILSNNDAIQDLALRLNYCLGFSVKALEAYALTDEKSDAETAKKWLQKQLAEKLPYITISLDDWYAVYDNLENNPTWKSKPQLKQVIMIIFSTTIINDLNNDVDNEGNQKEVQELNACMKLLRDNFQHLQDDSPQKLNQDLLIECAIQSLDLILENQKC